MGIEVDIYKKGTHGHLFKDATRITHPHFYGCRTHVDGQERNIFVLSAYDYDLGKNILNLEKLPANSPFGYYRDLGASAEAKPTILNNLRGRDHFQADSGNLGVGGIDMLVLPKGVCDPPAPPPGRPVPRKWTTRGFVNLTEEEIAAQRHSRL